MTKLLIVVPAALLVATAACRDRDTERQDDEVLAPKPVVPDDDTEHTAEPTPGPAAPARLSAPASRMTDEFVQTRDAFEEDMRRRLDRIDARIDELEGRTDAESRDAAARLSEQREQLTSRLDAIDDQTEASWDRYTSDVSNMLDQLERELDSLAP